MPAVRAEIEIASSRSAVWRVLADFGGIEKWSPVVLRSYSTTEAKEGLGARRHCDLAPRGTVEEQVIEWEPERHLGVNVDPAGPIAAQRATFDISGAEPVHVTMTITFELRAGMDDARDRVASAFQSAVRSSLAGLEYHVETGKTVGTEVPTER
jgi:uncharacterized protein YndB with AHSA1/START domain